jgi:cytoskeletal protein CcmA (bactofilin family)
MNHFDEMTCMLYLDGQLEAERARELTAHTEGCAECRALLGALAGEGRWLKEALVEEDEAVPARLLEPRTRADSVPWGWIAAFGFGSAGAYTLWSNILQPVQQQFNQAGFSGENLLTVLLFNGALWKGWETMRSLVEFLAMTTFGILILVLLRRNWRRWTTVAVVMGALLCALALPRTASAAELHKGKGTYTLNAGQEVKNDLIVGAGIVRIEGTVDGDLIVFAQSLRVQGHVTGDVIAFVQDLRVSGQVDGNVRGFARTLIVDGQVAKNVSAFADTTELDTKAKIGHNVYLFSGVATLEGEIGRDLMAFVGHTELNGIVDGDFWISSDRLAIGPNTQVKGRARYRGHNQPEVATGAKLANPLEVQIVSRRPDYASGRYYWHQALLWGSAFLVGLALLLLAPGIISDTVRSIDRFGVSIGFGALLLIATPVVVVIACITLVGIGVGIATLFLYLIGIYAGQCFIGTWLGEKILGAGVGTGAMIGRLALGLAVIRVLRMVPHVGGLIMAFVMCWGLGALAVALYRRAHPQAAAA